MKLVSLADAMRQELGSDSQISIARGCALFEPGVIKVPRDITNFLPLPESSGPKEISDAGCAGENLRVVVLALGRTPDWSGEDASRSEMGIAWAANSNV